MQPIWCAPRRPRGRRRGTATVEISHGVEGEASCAASVRTHVDIQQPLLEQRANRDLGPRSSSDGCARAPSRSTRCERMRRLAFGIHDARRLEHHRPRPAPAHRPRTVPDQGRRTTSSSTHRWTRPERAAGSPGRRRARAGQDSLEVADHRSRAPPPGYLQISRPRLVDSVPRSALAGPAAGAIVGTPDGGSRRLVRRTPDAQHGSLFTSRSIDSEPSAGALHRPNRARSRSSAGPYPADGAASESRVRQVAAGAEPGGTNQTQTVVAPPPGPPSSSRRRRSSSSSSPTRTTQSGRGAGRSPSQAATTAPAAATVAASIAPIASGTGSHRPASRRLQRSAAPASPPGARQKARRAWTCSACRRPSRPSRRASRRARPGRRAGAPGLLRHAARGQRAGRRQRRGVGPGPGQPLGQRAARPRRRQRSARQAARRRPTAGRRRPSGGAWLDRPDGAGRRRRHVQRHRVVPQRLRSSATACRRPGRPVGHRADQPTVDDRPRSCAREDLSIVACPAGRVARAAAILVEPGRDLLDPVGSPGISSAGSAPRVAPVMPVPRPRRCRGDRAARARPAGPRWRRSCAACRRARPPARTRRAAQAPGVEEHLRRPG